MRRVHLGLALLLTLSVASTASAQLLAPVLQIVGCTLSGADLTGQPDNTVWGNLAEAHPR